MVASSIPFMYLIDADTHLPLFNLLHNLLFEGVTGFGNGPVDDTGSMPWVPGLETVRDYSEMTSYRVSQKKVGSRKK